MTVPQNHFEERFYTCLDLSSSSTLNLEHLAFCSFITDCFKNSLSSISFEFIFPYKIGTERIYSLSACFCCAGENGRLEDADKLLRNQDQPRSQIYKMSYLAESDVVLSQIRAAGEILNIDVIDNIFIEIYIINRVALLKYFNSTLLQFTDGLQRI